MNHQVSLTEYRAAVDAARQMIYAHSRLAPNEDQYSASTQLRRMIDSKLDAAMLIKLVESDVAERTAQAMTVKLGDPNRVYIPVFDIYEALWLYILVAR